MWVNIKVVLLLTTLFNLLSASQAIPLLVLKLPHTGSSWFTSLLNSREGVFVGEELFRSLKPTLDKNKWTNSTTLLNESSAYLAEALRHPMRIFPRGEFPHDNRDLVVVGASLGPIGSWVNLEGLTKIVPDIRVLLYVRTNKVKHVISSFRASELSRQCGGDMVITGQCRLKKRTVVNLKEFDNMLIRQLGNDKIMLDTATFLRKDTGQSHFTRLSYEGLMGDEFVVDSIMRWAGVSSETLNWRSKAVTGRCKDGCSKTTPDDLREVLKNYEEVESWIESNYPCLLHQFHETRRDIVQKSVEHLCGNIFEDRIEDFVAAHSKRNDIILSGM